MTNFPRRDFLVATAAMLGAAVGPAAAQTETKISVVTVPPRARYRPPNRFTVSGTRATVGPPLDQFAARRFVAGELQNTPDNLIKWIMTPQTVEPGSAMPNMHVTEQAARDMASYLYTLK